MDKNLTFKENNLASNNEQREFRLAVWNARSYNIKFNTFVKKNLKEEDIDLMAIIEFRFSFNFEINNYNIIKDNTGWNAVIYKEHIDLN